MMFRYGHVGVSAHSILSLIIPSKKKSFKICTFCLKDPKRSTPTFLSICSIKHNMGV